MNQATFNYVPEPEDQDDGTEPTKTCPSPDQGNTRAQTGTELVLYKEKPVADVFKQGGARSVVDEIKEKVNSLVLDVSTEKGRKEIASVAYQVARTKTALDSEGKKLKDKYQVVCNEIDSERKLIREELDLLKDAVRKPLTDFENKEKDRVQAHEDAIKHLSGFSTMGTIVVANVEAYNKLLADSDEFFHKRNWEEFEDRAKFAFNNNFAVLTQKRDDQIKHDADQAELARLREAEELRKKKEHENKIAADAAAEAKAIADKEAEEKLEKEREETARVERELHNAETARINAHNAALRTLTAFSNISGQESAELIQHRSGESEAFYQSRDWEEFAEWAESQRNANAAILEQAHKKRIDDDEKKAEEDRIAAEKKAQAEKDAAVLAERKRLEDEVAAQKAIDDARAANEAHVSKINNEAKEAILKVASILDAQERASAIITAIAQGKIPHVNISY
jgi:hypothetical protein